MTDPTIQTPVALAFYFRETNTSRVVIGGTPDANGVRDCLDIVEDEGRGFSAIVTVLQEQGRDFDAITLIDNRDGPAHGTAVKFEHLGTAEVLELVASDEL